MNKYASWAICLSVGILVGGMAVAVRMTPKQAITGALAPELVGQKTAVETLPVKTYPQAVNNKLGVPTGKVLTATKIPPRNTPQTVTAVLDQEGNTTLYVRDDPSQWFGMARKHDLSLIYGVMDSHGVYRLQYRYDLVQVKHLNLGVSSGVNIGGDEHRGLVGISLSYQW